MSMPHQDEIVRHEDGTIDVRFYARRATELRRQARARLLRRFITALVKGCAALAIRLVRHRDAPGRHRPVPPQRR